jgi:biotin transport system permease protein
VLSYRPGTTVAHRLDPRTKLAVQFAFAAAAVAHTTPRGLAALTGVVALVLAAGRTSPLAAGREFRVALPFLVAAPLVEGLVLGPPWFSVAQARFPALASYRVLLILVVSAVYVRTTPVRESRAAIQWALPGRAGQFLGTAVALVVRFLPVLRADLGRAREATDARLGTERPLHERMRLVATAGLRRTFERSDTLALALQARCLAWNPTLPGLSLRRWDLPALAVALALAVAALPLP